MKKRRSWTWVFMAVIFGFSLAYVPQVRAAEKYAVFGETEPLTGPTASMGLQNKRMVELVVERLNQEGGVKVKGETYKLRVICEDNKGTTEGAIAATNKLVYKDSVKWLINYPTTACLASQVVTEPAKVIGVQSGLHKDILSPQKPYSFRYFISTMESAPLQVKWILQHLPNLKSSWMTQPDDASGVAINEAWNTACTKFGIKVLGFDYVSRSASDFYPLLTKIMAQNPDILGAAAGDQGALLLKQAREKGYKGQFVLPVAASPSYIKVGGEKNLEGMLHIGVDPESDLTPKLLRDISKDYHRKYGEDPGTWSAWVAAAPYLFAQAIAKAGTLEDVDKIKSAMEKEWFETPWGPVKFGGEKTYGLPHQLFHPVFVSTVKNGKIIALARFDTAEIQKIMGE